MSIPPLVCSTPPPPEQCEDDKDPDDFDLNYNLSQEDDSTEYDYGNFSSFNNIQSSTTESCQDHKPQIVNSEDSKYEDKLDQLHDTEWNNRVEMTEDDIIEDLDLKIDLESAVGVAKSIKESEVIFKKVSAKDINTDIPLNNTNTQDEFHLATSNPETIVIDSNVNNEMVVDVLNITQRNETERKPCSQKPDNLSFTHLDNDTGNDITASTQETDSDMTTSPQEIENNITITPQEAENNTITLPQKIEKNITTLPQEIDDNIVQENDNDNNFGDFEDFDDFQFISSNNKPEIILNTSENPWENDQQVTKNIGFGEFTANFESNQETSPARFSQVQEDNDTDDDFGDFDEFKSVHETKSNTSPPDISLCKEVPVLNLQSSDSENQIIERINECMCTIFQQEMSEPEETIENRIENLLGVTWGYLLETDVRQPYIVNWNNSLAQKTLLKALCIDSRNILYGPKWSSNMPKYAANLSTAPLQPQKQPGQSNAPQSEIGQQDKAGNKTSWVDPFTSDGQEFTYAEALLLDLEHLMATLDQMAHNHSTLKISELLSHACSAENESVVIEAGPTDLDVFEASVTTKTDKIYSNTLSMQPMRQINLPDTHIFTPTDSETPRSKTIHYDDRSAPAGLLPISDAMPQQTHSMEDDNDDWEFQDFRGSTQSNDLPPSVKEEPKTQVLDTRTSAEIAQKSNYNIETQVLQPVKLELIMPTLNWPDPGEVKETFDDFTDFISNASSNDEKVGPVSQSTNISTKFIPEPAKSTTGALGENNNEDDEFEMFQSAIPQLHNTSHSAFSNIDKKLVLNNTVATSRTTSNLAGFDVSFDAADKDMRSENISVAHTRKSEHVNKNEENDHNINGFIFSSPTIQPTAVPFTNVLQPTIATPSGPKATHQKTSQILQPLSLESYSQINWPNPGINLQDLSRFNPVETLQSLKSESSSQSKTASPVHSQKGISNQTSDDDGWGEFVSSKPKQQTLPKKPASFADDDEWTDFVSSPSVNPHNGLNTISLNVHTNSSLQKSNTSKYQPKVNQIPLDIPTLNYITPKTTSQSSYNERHFQNL